MTLEDFLKLPGAKVHDGSGCPVDGDMIVEVMFADGETDTIYADFWSAAKVGMDDQWTGDCSGTDLIIAYREAP